MEQCEMCNKEIGEKEIVKSAKQCDCFVKYADRYMRHHHQSLMMGVTPMSWEKYAARETRSEWSLLYRHDNRKHVQHWIIKVEVAE